MNKVNKRFQNLMLISLVMVVVDVLVGLLLMNYFDFSERVFSVIVGSVILLHGLFFTIRYLYDGLGKNVFRADIVAAVVCVLIGLFQMFGPFTSYKSLGIFFGIYLLAQAAEKGYFGFVFFKKREEMYPIICFLAVLIFVMAIVVMLNPFERFMLSTKLSGMFLICSGLFDALFSVLFRNRSTQVLKSFK